MTNVWDAVDYLDRLWGLFTGLRAAKEAGAVCQSNSQDLGRGALFDATDIAAFDTIMGKVKAEGQAILAMGGDRALAGESTHYSAWVPEE